MSDTYAEASQKARAWLQGRNDKLVAENHRLRDANRELMNLVMSSFGHRSEIYEAARKYDIARRDLSETED